MIGLDVIISQAVTFSWHRHPHISSERIFKIKLDGMVKYEEIISQIAKSLKLVCVGQDCSDNKIIEEISSF